MAGQYGVGLLGFWSIGRYLEMRTRVDGSDLFALRLEENKPTARIAKLPVRLDASRTFTELVLSEVHPSAQRMLGGRRLSDYLAAELRGQLLAHDVELTIEDRQARGTAQKHFRVMPRQFVGEPLQVPAQIEVEGHPAMRIELYASEGLERPTIQVGCSGTLVADDVGELRALLLDHRPWVGKGLSGIVDFPGLQVPPGTRRGVVPNEAATAFVAAMERLQPSVEEELARLERERVAAADREVVRELRRALKGFRRRLPQYDLPDVEAAAGSRDGVGPGEPVGDEAASTEGTAPMELFPAGPLGSVSIEPDPVRIPTGRERRVRAIALDTEQRPKRTGVTYQWHVGGAGLSLRASSSARPAVVAQSDARPHQAGTVQVTATGDTNGQSASAEARVFLVDEDLDEPGHSLGIPEPEMVNDPGARWRSRMNGSRWQVNRQPATLRALRPAASEIVTIPDLLTWGV